MNESILLCHNLLEKMKKLIISELNEVKKIYDKAKKEDINLVNIPIRHLGTEKSHELYGRIEKYITDNGVEILFDTTVSDLVVEENIVKGVVVYNGFVIETNGNKYGIIGVSPVDFMKHASHPEEVSKLKVDDLDSTISEIQDDINLIMLLLKGILSQTSNFQNRSAYYLPPRTWKRFKRNA